MQAIERANSGKIISSVIRGWEHIFWSKSEMSSVEKHMLLRIRLNMICPSIIINYDMPDIKKLSAKEAYKKCM